LKEACPKKERDAVNSAVIWSEENGEEKRKKREKATESAGPQ